LKRRIERRKIVTNDEDGGVISEHHSRVRRKDRWKIVDESREEGRTEYRTLWNTRAGKTKCRAGVFNMSNMGTVGEIGLEPRNSR
jgi:orotate phosphoribosyltransferase-like protein